MPGIVGKMGFYKPILRSAVSVAAMVWAPPAFAQGVDRPASSFAVVAQPVDDAPVQVARPNRGFLKFDVRPLSAVTLGEAVPAELAAQFGAKSDVPFDSGRQLYGWPERPGLYCDLLRPRGLGISTACLRDIDGDGRFDQGLRLDFNSGLGDLLVISHSGKIIGVRSKPKTVPLPKPVAYAPSAPMVTGKLALRWKPGKKVAGAPTAEMWISTPGNYTGTEGLSENVLAFRRESAPLDVELYGIRLKILGFDEEGGMKYRLLGMTDGAAVALLFRGYTFRYHRLLTPTPPAGSSPSFSPAPARRPACRDSVSPASAAPRSPPPAPRRSRP